MFIIYIAILKNFSGFARKNKKTLLNKSVYLKNLFHINLIAIFIALLDFCHFDILYSVYFISTGTSINFILFEAIISSSSYA
jgi:hypothetical protein